MSIRRRSKVWAYCLSLFVLGASVWLPMTALAQVVPGTPFGAGGSSGGSAFPVSDTVFKVCDDGDATKCWQMQLSGVTTGNTVTPIVLSGSSAATIVTLSPTRTVMGAGSLSINSTGGVQLASGSPFGFSSTASVDSTSACDTCFTRAAANVFGLSAGDWTQQTNGRSTLAADYTNATTTFSNTALSITVISGRKYTFKSVLFISDSIAADGAKFDFNGGSAAATDFRVHCTLFDTALLLSTQATALATAFSQATVTGSGMFECYGSFEPSGAGTFILRAAQNAHTTGTLTVFRGSNIWVEDTP